MSDPDPGGPQTPSRTRFWMPAVIASMVMAAVINGSVVDGVTLFSSGSSLSMDERRRLALKLKDAVETTILLVRNGVHGARTSVTPMGSDISHSGSFLIQQSENASAVTER
jgi:hypothetical protein